MLPHAAPSQVPVSGYLVSLDVFQGPLDLLLRLIEREELDITLVSLAVVADQYVAHIAELQEVSASNLADFLVIAARLLVIKSRVLLPQPAEGHDEQADDWGTLLVEQLREYKRFKEVAAKLRDIEHAGLRTYSRVAPPPRIERHLEAGEVTLEHLIDAFKRILEAHPPVPPVDEVVSPIVVRIADCIEAILKRVGRYRRVRFGTLMRRSRSRIEIIVNFLAMLELIKQQRVQATQKRPFGEIYLEACQPDPEVRIPPTDLGDCGEPDGDTEAAAVDE